MKLYAVSYTDNHGVEDGYLLEFFSRKTDALKRARDVRAEDNQVFHVSKIRVPTRKADMIRFLNRVNYGIISGEKVLSGGE